MTICLKDVVYILLR